MTDPEELDGIDLKILSELQKDGRIRNNELASRVGISPPPCQRRMRSLRERGVIRSIRATLDERHLGYEGDLVRVDPAQTSNTGGDRGVRSSG
jgi:DNA-binding Lrp family transcriptional regulator